jgi:Zn-dependent protease
MGSLFFLMTFFMASPVVIGWAKPVPINPRHFRDYRKGMITVAVAGPLANFALALLFGLLLTAYIQMTGGMAQPRGTGLYFLGSLLFAGISINVTLAWFNLIPIPPLDGSKILANILPRELAIAYESIARYGFFILIALMFLGLFRVVLYPLVINTVGLILKIYGLS